MRETLSRMGRALQAVTVAACCLAVSPISIAVAQESIEPDAATVLASMSSYLGGLQSFTAQYDVEIDTVSYEGEKLQFSSSGELTVQRPNKLYVTRKGAIVDAEFILDGTAVTIFGSNLNGYIQFPATSIEEAVDTIRENTGFDAPGADLLSAKPLDPEATDVLSGVHVGMAYVGGAEVHHLAFRGKTVDWQLWVQAGDQPLPLKYVITNKWVTGAPEYTLRLLNWNSSPQIDANRFTFTPPTGATALDSVMVDEIGQFSNEGE
jgi:hypothetical protein